MEFEIIFYSDENNNEPVKDFIIGLEPKMQAKVLRMLSLLETNGYDLREPYSKPLTNGIFELRIISNSNISRILYFFITGKKIILTNGFIKKTQKTPVSEMQKALKYKADFLLREDSKND